MSFVGVEVMLIFEEELMLDVEILDLDLEIIII